MNKTVLFLINGLGIEKADSCNVYNEQLMPNMDQLINEHLFTSIATDTRDYNSGYQIFSMGNTDPLGYSFLENLIEENKFGESPNFNTFKNSLHSLDGTIHVFCLLDNERVVEHLKGFIRALEIDPNKKVFVHVVFPQKLLDDYKRLIKVLNKLNYDSLTQIKIGMIFGLGIIEQPEKSNELLDLGRMFFRGTGERWNELDKKLETLWGMKIVPREVKGFCVTEGFSLHDNDMIFIFNYEGIVCDRLLQLISNPPMSITHSVNSQTLRFQSLFPLRTTMQIPYLYEPLSSETSMAKALEQAGLTALVLADQENINLIYYMANGLTMKAPNDKVKFAVTDNGILFSQEKMSAIINDPNYQVIVINHRIDQATSVEELQAKLSQIDQNLAMVKGLCWEKYTLIVSSLFGIKKELSLGNRIGLVNFSGSVPVILVDKRYDKSLYKLSFGSIYTLLGTSIRCANPEMKFPTLLKKKDFLTRLLFKK